jgi:general secretion pathway protein J
MTGIQTPEGDALMFVRRSPDPQQDEQRLGYRLRQGRLELLLWSELDTLAAKDQASALLAPLPPASTIYPLLEGVKTFELRYLDTAKHWQTRWPANDPTALPRAVQLSMQLADGQTIARLFALP